MQQDPTTVGTQHTTTYHTDWNKSARLGKATGWTNEDTWFYFRQKQKIYFVSKEPTRVWGPPNLLISTRESFRDNKTAGS